MWADDSYTVESPNDYSIVAYNHLTAYNGKYARNAANHGGSVQYSLLAYDCISKNSQSVYNIVLYSAVNITGSDSIIAYNSVSNGYKNIVLYNSSALFNAVEYGSFSDFNILMYNSTNDARKSSDLVYASGYYAIGSDQSNITTFTCQPNHDFELMMYDSTTNVNYSYGNMILYGSTVNAYMSHTILAYNSTNTGTNYYACDKTYKMYNANDHTQKSIAMYDSSLNDEAETIKLWNNKIVIKPYGFVNGVAIYDNAKIGSIAADTNINNYIRANQTAVAVFI